MTDLNTTATQNYDKHALSPQFVQIQTALDDVVTIDTLQAAHPDLFTKPQLSWLLKTRHKNGLDQLTYRPFLNREPTDDWKNWTPEN